MRDPNGAVTGGAADRPIACGNDLTGCPAERRFCIGAIQIARQAQHRIQDSWKAIGTTNLPEHRGTGFSPVNGAISLLHSGLPTAFDVPPAVIEGFRHKGLALDVVYGL